MKTLALALAGFAMIGSTAHAATLSKTTYTTARKAALAGAAYHFNKALKYGRYSTKDLKITRVLDGSGKDQKFRVESKNGVRSKIVSVRLDGKKFRAFLPNKSVRTPDGTTRK